MAIYSRINARAGSIVDLNMRILRNGQLQSPFALREITIYRGSISPGNVVATIPFPDPAGTIYPTPATEVSAGEFVVPFLVPEEFITGDVYFDVWSFVGSDPGASGTSGVNDTSLWVSQQGMFWVFDDVWISDEDLRTLRVGFEPLDKRLRRGEVRTIEVAIHPLPLYDYDYNALTPILPQLSPTITIHTGMDELIVSDAPCQMGVRQGRSRNSPYVVQCLINTKTLVRGMYKYTIKVNVGGKTIISPRFNFTLQ